MSDKQTIEALIERLEKATGPDRTLDADILRAVGHQCVQRGGILGWEYRENGVGVWRSMPSPTESIDAALTLLVPPFSWEQVCWASDGSSVVASAGNQGNSDGYRNVDGEHPVAAIAIAIASLRARISNSMKEGG
jgi:hypothetical protein